MNTLGSNRGNRRTVIHLLNRELPPDHPGRMNIALFSAVPPEDERDSISRDTLSKTSIKKIDGQMGRYDIHHISSEVKSITQMSEGSAVDINPSASESKIISEEKIDTGNGISTCREKDIHEETGAITELREENRILRDELIKLSRRNIPPCDIKDNFLISEITRIPTPQSKYSLPSLNTSLLSGSGGIISQDLSGENLCYNRSSSSSPSKEYLMYTRQHGGKFRRESSEVIDKMFAYSFWGEGHHTLCGKTVDLVIPDGYMQREYIWDNPRAMAFARASYATLLLTGSKPSQANRYIPEEGRDSWSEKHER